MPLTTSLLLLGYLAAAVSLLRAAVVSRSGARLGGRWPGPERRRTARRHEDRRRTVAWFVLAGTVAAAGTLRVSGGLDALSHLGRGLVKDLGWYAGRDPWQLAATAAAGAACLGLLGAVARSRRAHRRQRLAIAAAAALTALLAVRAISWHDAGVMMGRRIQGVRMSAWLEVGILLALALAGVRAARPHRMIRRHARGGSAPSRADAGQDADGRPGLASTEGQPPATAASSDVGPAGSGATV